MLFTLEAELEEDSSFKDIFLMSSRDVSKRSAKISMLVVDFYKLIR